MRGVMYERLAHRKLQQGGKFTCRDLDSGKVFEEELKQDMDVRIFTSLEDLSKARAGVYCKPFSGTWESIDAVIPVGVCWQVAPD